jgi:hypothetical protein
MPDGRPGRVCYCPGNGCDASRWAMSKDSRIDQATLRERLNALRSEHRDLDDVIDRLSEDKPFDQLQLQRLKKRKLGLKDEILKLESQLLPDIIA